MFSMKKQILKINLQCFKKFGLKFIKIDFVSLEDMLLTFSLSFFPKMVTDVPAKQRTC